MRVVEFKILMLENYLSSLIFHILLTKTLFYSYNVHVLREIYMKKQIIPIFFSTDDNYIPMLDVAITSLIENASRDYKYVINILNTGLRQDNMDKILSHSDRNFEIIFRDIKEDVKPIKEKLKNLYHFSIACYYRLFIQELFPEYDRAIYLDCDIVVLGDISKLYAIHMGKNLIGGVKCSIIGGNPLFSKYAEESTGRSAKFYINSGILLMNLKEIRKAKIQQQFMYLTNKYNFDIVDPDQVFLNFLCRDRIKYLENGWNKQSIPEPVQGELNIAHFALYKKPWQFDDVINGEYFWEYAKKSNFYKELIEIRASFDEEKILLKEEANKELAEHVVRVIEGTNNTFKRVLLDKNINWVSDMSKVDICCPFLKKIKMEV